MSTRNTIYLDGAASTPLAPEVLEKLTQAHTHLYGNPSSLHAAGIAARSELEKARRSIGRYFGVAAREIHFTSGATEANNLALVGTARERRRGHILSVGTEHSSVLSPLRYLAEEGFETTLLPVNSQGELDLEQLRMSIRPDTFLISVMMVNNETGLIHPVHEIGKIAREKGILFHCDATQALRSLEVRPKELGIHLLSASGHKIYGPKGVGLLFIDEEIAWVHQGLTPLLWGGPQEHGMRAGTENVPSILGLAEAFRVLEKNLDKDRRESLAKKRKFLEALKGLPFVVNGSLEHCAANILNLRFEGVSVAAMMRHLDHLHLSAGSACSGSLPSHVLTAMGVSPAHVTQSFRVGFGRENSEQDIERAAADIVEYVKNVSE